MNWLLLGLAILLGRTLWGFGLAWWLLPPGMRRYTLLFAPMAGAALQMAVVWVGAHVNFPGTTSYAGWSSLLPAGLLIAAGIRMGRTGRRKSLGDMMRLSGVVVIVVMALAVSILPASRFGHDPTTVSLGGCDAGSYAAGAEALKHHAADDRTGFLGQVGPNLRRPELGLHHWWMHYDHFGPVALLAMTATMLDRDVCKILTLEAATYWAMLLPMVFWLARQGFRFGPRSAGVVTLILAVSPVAQYVVHHGLLGQLLATGATVIMWWAAIGLLRSTSRREWWGMVAWATVGHALLIGSYAFFLPLVYAPLLIHAGVTVIWPEMRAGRVDRRQALECLDKWIRGMGAALLISGAFYGARLGALPYHYSDLSTHAYGWEIPAFNAVGLLGGFDSWQLTPKEAWWPWLVLLGAGVALVGTHRRGILRWSRAAVAVLVGVVGVYALFACGLVGGHQPSSYRTFKVISVAYPLVVLMLLAGLRLLDQKKTIPVLAGGALAAGVLILNLSSTARIVDRIKTAPLVVDSMLGAVRRINAMDEVTSVNVLFPEVWPRLWSSAYMLGKLQYYDRATYEGRPPSALAGEWDLSYATIRVIPAREADQVWLNPMYHLTRHEQAQKVRGQFGRGWHAEETLHHHRWRWSHGVGRIELFNESGAKLAVTFKVVAARSVPGDAAIRLNGTEIFRGRCADEPGVVTEFSTELPPGGSTLDFDPLAEEGRLVDGGRRLGVAVYRVDVCLPPSAD